MFDNIQIKDKSDTGGLFKISAFKEEIRKTTPHKHNKYLEIVYFSRGSGTHNIDGNAYKIEPPVVFLIRKEQVHHWDIDTPPKGYVIIIKKEFVNRSLDGELKKVLSELTLHPSLKIHSAHVIDCLFELLAKESIFTVVEGLLKALFTKILETSQAHTSNAIKTKDLFQAFTELLKNSNDLKNNVGFYAKLLNTTPQNLNHICQQTARQSASQLIAEYIISEAKRLLFYTDKTVAEIAYSLHFKDNSHFTKYFKKQTNQTPSQYRKENY